MPHAGVVVFKAIFDRTDAVAVRQEAEDSGAWRLSLVVKHERWWFTFVRNFLQDAHDDASFGAEAQKAFYLDPGSRKLRFTWVLLIWGDADVAAAAVAEAVKALSSKALTTADRPRSRRAPAPRPSPKTAEEPAPPVGRSRLKRQYKLVGKERVVVTTMNLPHVRQGVERWATDANTTVGLHSPRFDSEGRRRVFASASTISEG